VRTAADAPVAAMAIQVNGVLQAGTHQVPVASSGQTLEINVELPEQDAEIQIFANNKYGISAPATLHLKWAGKVADKQDITKQ
jgi:hypothetical protein